MYSLSRAKNISTQATAWWP